MQLNHAKYRYFTLCGLDPFNTCTSLVSFGSMCSLSRYFLRGSAGQKWWWVGIIVTPALDAGSQEWTSTLSRCNTGLLLASKFSNQFKGRKHTV